MDSPPAAASSLAVFQGPAESPRMCLEPQQAQRHPGVGDTRDAALCLLPSGVPP